MKRPSIAVMIAVAALWGCADAEAPPKPKAPPPQDPALLHTRGPDDSEERINLLNFAHGAVVVSRTGEASLQNSALEAIDGDPLTAWLSPPDDPDQSLVFALPARARVHTVGVRIGSETFVQPKAVEFAASADGNRFKTIGSFPPAPGGTQISEITPVETRYIRFSTRGGNGQFVRALSVYARGELLEPVRPGSLDGCWSVNGTNASFSQQGGYVTGAMAGTIPIAIEGGSDGRFYRLLWIRGPQYGVAAISVTSDGKRLSGVFWHEEAYNRFISETWFGERSPCTESPRSDVDVLEVSMQRYGRYALYGLQFDSEGHLSEVASAPMLGRLAAYARGTKGLKLVAHELGQPDKARNQAVSQVKIGSVRAALEKEGVAIADIAFVAVGSDDPHRPADTDAARSIYGAVELVK